MLFMHFATCAFSAVGEHTALCIGSVMMASLWWRFVNGCKKEKLAQISDRYGIIDAPPEPELVSGLTLSSRSSC